MKDFVLGAVGVATLWAAAIIALYVGTHIAALIEITWKGVMG